MSEAVHTMVNQLLGTILPGCEAVPANSVPRGRRYAVLKAHGYPKWILPLDWRRARTVCRQWEPLEPASRLKWALLKGACRLNALDSIPGVPVIGLRSDFADWSDLGVRGDIMPVIHISRPTRRRKAVVMPVAGDGSVKCAVKLAIGEHAADSIAAEYRALQILESLAPGAAPRALGHRKGLLAMEWIEGRMPQHSAPQDLNSYLSGLRSGGETSLVGVAERTRQAVEMLAASSSRDQLCAMLDSVTCREKIPATIVHGDFAPWNLIHAGRLRAIDWEYADPDCAPILDVIHYVLSLSLETGKVSDFAWAQERLQQSPVIRRMLDGAGLPLRHARDALALYVPHVIVSRYARGERLYPVPAHLSRLAGSFGAAPC